MARLSLSLLGPLRITIVGQPASGFAYNKVRALLAYLAADAGRPHHRDTLVGLLWPELPDTAARTNLRQALANLREAIGDADAKPPFLLITRDTIQLNPASDYDLDVAAFEALLATCETHAHRHLDSCRSCAARTERAIALYSGDFLAEFSVGDSAPFEEWQLRVRERLHQRALDTLARLADYHGRRGEDEPARRYAERQIELDPWREEAHRQLMRLLARGGQRSAALAEYERCRRTLADELGVDPEAETTALYECIRDIKLKTENEKMKNTDTQRFSIFNSQFSSSRHNFPAQTTGLIGRATELAELGALLENPACRLITITGPGGIGKTRLALAVAADQAETFTDGAAFVPLQAISAAAFVAPAILAALGLMLQGQRDPRQQLLDFLRVKELLLVLDNFEHLIDSAPLVGDLLAAAPRLTVLITSRSVLQLSGEHKYDVPPLTLPGEQLLRDLPALARVPAVDLFVQRSQMVKADFRLNERNAAAVAAICQQLDGLPLAIELAAARVKLFPPQALLERLGNRLTFLTGGACDLPTRQRTIRTTIDWSYQLLDTAEQRLFARLGVFVGGCTLQAADAICTTKGDLPNEIVDGLAALVDKSLLQGAEGRDGEPRFTMLETIREYALERLEVAGEFEAVRRGHAEYYVALAEAAEPALSGPQQQRWMERLQDEHDNLRAALAWSQAAADGAELSLRLAGALGWFWVAQGYLREGRAWLAQALARPEAASPALVRAKALLTAGHLAATLGDPATTEALYTESLALFGALADQRGSATTLANLGLMALQLGDFVRATALLEQSLALHREVGNRVGAAVALIWLGNVAREQGEYVQAWAHLAASLARFDELGDVWGRGLVLLQMGDVAWAQGETTQAMALYEEALVLSREAEQSDRTAYILSNLGHLIQLQGDAAQALALLDESVAWFRQANHHGLEWALYHRGVVAYAQGDDVRAAADLREALGMQQQCGMKGRIGRSLERLAGLAARQQRPARAVRLFSAAATLREAIGTPLPPGEPANYDRDLASAHAQLDDATFAAAWAEGKAMTLEQAIAYALEGSASDVEQSARAVAAAKQRG